VSIVEKALRPEHPNVAMILENYATLLGETDRPRRGKAGRNRQGDLG